MILRRYSLVSVLKNVGAFHCEAAQPDRLCKATPLPLRHAPGCVFLPNSAIYGARMYTAVKLHTIANRRASLALLNLCVRISSEFPDNRIK
jgi:hypothetical protein